MNQQPDASAYPDDEIDLRELIRKVWDGKWLIVLITLLSSAMGVVYALLATEIYRAEALVQPRQESRTGGGLGALAAQFGGLADFAGVSLAGGSDRAVAIATLKSRTLIESFIQERNLLPRMYEDAWDSQAKNWKNPDPRKIPTIWQAYNDFTGSIFKIAEDKKTGLVTVAVEWKDPVEAQEWVTELIARTNAYLKAKAIEEGERNLAYLEAQSRTTGQVELRQAVFGLVEAELKKLMIAKGGEEFAIKTIDAAVVPKKRARPKRAQIAVLGFLLGGFVGVVWVLVRGAWRQEPVQR
jgi:uncharacterized protein involved in exopolysaccharide biosynthesis